VKPTKNNTLFVVHGRDTELNEDMFGLLRALGLNPIEWSEAVAKTRGNNPDVDKIIGGQMKTVQGIVVLISPDEEAKLKTRFVDPAVPAERLRQDQARPNVLFEAGWAFGAYSFRQGRLSEVISLPRPIAPLPKCTLRRQLNEVPRLRRGSHGASKQACGYQARRRPRATRYPSSVQRIAGRTPLSASCVVH
jgi:hypothetical protein